MYSVSQAFHEAVESQAAKRLLFNFGDLMLDAGDISTGGVKFTETVNPDRDLTIGNAPESALEAVIINRDQLLSGYDFASSEFTASIGVHISDTDYSGIYSQIFAVSGFAPKLACMTADRLYAAHSAEPYLTAYSVSGGVLTQINVTAPASAPGCIVIDGGVRLGFPDGTMTDLAGANITLNPFMQNRVKRWCEQGLCAWTDGNNRHEYAFSDTNAWIDSLYEYCPLGVFIPERPETVLTYTIRLTAKDRLALFDVPVDDWFNNAVFPQTLGALAASLCNYAGVPLASETFFNSSMILDSRMVTADQWTGRDVLRWIAEAACSTARMSRDGELEFAWFDDADYTVKTRFSYKRAEYAVPAIDGLSVVGSENDVGVNIPIDGSATNAYRIMENPFLAGDTDAQVRQMAQPIHDRLTAFQAYSPVTVRTKGDWSVCAGDVITVLDGFTEEHSVPVFSQTLTFTGSVRVTYESTGSPTRSVEARANRRLLQERRAMHELVVDINGIRSRLEDAEGDITELILDIDNFSVEFIKKGEVVAAINLSPDTAKILASHISLEGLVTVNSNFKIELDGSMTANNGTFSGIVRTAQGEMGGFIISSTGITGPNFSLSSQTGRMHFGNFQIYPSGTGDALFIAGSGTLNLVAPSINVGDNTGKVYINGRDYS